MYVFKSKREVCMRKDEIVKTVFLALMMALIFVPAVFLTEVISYSSQVMAVIYISIVAGMYGLALVSRNKKIWLIKWGLSVPFSILVFPYFWVTEFSYRALNWAYPGYGQRSAGGKFYGMVLLLSLTGACLIAGLIASFFKLKERFGKAQIIVIALVAAATVAAVLVLDQMFPVVPLG